MGPFILRWLLGALVMFLVCCLVDLVFRRRPWWTFNVTGSLVMALVLDLVWWRHL